MNAVSETEYDRMWRALDALTKQVEAIEVRLQSVPELPVAPVIGIGMPPPPASGRVFTHDWQGRRLAVQVPDEFAEPTQPGAVLPDRCSCDEALALRRVVLEALELVDSCHAQWHRRVRELLEPG